jgi:hypothetical protein
MSCERRGRAFCKCTVNEMEGAIDQIFLWSIHSRSLDHLLHGLGFRAEEIIVVTICNGWSLAGIYGFFEY